MQNYSLTIMGVAVSIVGTVLVNYGFSEGCAGEITNTLPVLIGGVMAWYGRFRKGDVNVLGRRI